MPCNYQVNGECWCDAWLNQHYDVPMPIVSGERVRGNYVNQLNVEVLDYGIFNQMWED